MEGVEVSDLNVKADAKAWLCMDFFRFEAEVDDENKELW